MFKFLLLLFIVSCHSNSQLPAVGIKLKALYERDLLNWAQTNNSKKTPSSNYPAFIRTNDGVFKGKLSIRGDLSRHWKGERKSFRFKIRKDHYLKGMSELDLIVIEDKNFELETVGYELGKKLGLLTPNYEFISLAFNQNNLGPYLMLERFTSESMELRSLPEGEIIKESNAWLDSLVLKEKSRYKNIFFGKEDFNPLALREEIYTGTINGIHTGLALTHFSKMLKVMKGSDKIDWETFVDLDQASSWTALMVLMGSYHGILGDNLRWYYHPFGQTFRPIPYDLLPQRLPETGCPFDTFAKMNPWIKMWMKDQKFKTLLLEKIKTLTSNEMISAEYKALRARPDWNEIDVNKKSHERENILLHNQKILSGPLLCP